MKTVGLITMHGVLNYGSALQTYATQRMVAELGYDCTVIDYKYPTKYHLQNSQKRKKDRQLPLYLKVVYKLKHELSKIFFGDKSLEVKKRFNIFFHTCIKLSLPYYSLEAIHSNPPQFDIYLVGSDQVWNAHYAGDDTAWLLSFASKRSLLISYASSFGTNEILPQYVNQYKKHLSNFDVISVRETSGVEIIKNLTGKRADHVLDPTLLLNTEQWAEISRPIKVSNKPYILCYLLSYSINPFPYAYDVIEYLRKHTGITTVLLINLGSFKDSLKEGYSVVNNIGPCEFISLFQNASFVLTSSFHGTAFAINFSKDFFSIVNPSIGDDRIESLLEMVNAEERALPIGNSMPNPALLSMDFSQIQQRLSNERSKSINYLKHALNGKYC